MLTAENLSKRFGQVTAVDGLTFTAQAGRVTGFLGPNGSGKSTTLRMLLGLDQPDTGRASVKGTPYRALRDPLRTIGALTDANTAHGGMRAKHHLRWVAHSNGIDRARVPKVLDLVGLSSKSRARVGTFSLGMRQRLGIATALLGDPDILVLDEPVNGLDADGIRWIRTFLRDLAAQGRTVLLSSHLMHEMSQIADHLIVIGHGRLLADASMDEFMREHGDSSVRVRVGKPTQFADLLRTSGFLVAPQTDGYLRVRTTESRAVARLAAEAGMMLEEITTDHTSLEDAYVRLTGDTRLQRNGAREDSL